MSPHLFVLGPEIGAPLANHIWQSTLFAALAGLLALLLRNNHASTRYWLWLLASVKFLFPFSLLVAVGNHLNWSKLSSGAPSEFFLVVQGVGRPFAAAHPIHGAVGTAMLMLTRYLPFLLLFVWCSGFLIVLSLWWSRWRYLSATVRDALAVGSGRAFELLKRLERSSGTIGALKLAAANPTLEPGVIGIFHPVLLLPAGICDKLSDAQLHAVLSHELCHVRRRDNLAATVHMLIEALFWFHPLVWWIGARLLDERERACDEEVVRLGANPQIYAESILKICEFYLESSLLCTSGVTGSNLKTRIETIMLHRAPLNLDLRKKLLLAAAAALVVATPVVSGILNPTPRQTASKPGSSVHSSTKFVLGDLKIEGDVHDRDGLRDRVLQAWKHREYDDPKELAEAVAQVGIRVDIQDRGYFKAVIGDPISSPLDIAEGEQRIRITIPVTEGKQYRLGSLTIRNSEQEHPLSIPMQTLREQFHLRNGDLFKTSAVRSGMESVRKLYLEKGFAYTMLEPRVDVDDMHQLLALVIQITEKPDSK